MTLLLYVLRLLSAAVVISTGGLFFITIPGIVVSAVHKVGGGNMGALLGYLPLVLVDMVPYLLPIGFLLALVATYGRLAADNEWTAISMAGVHPARMMLPALAVACLLGGVSHWLSTEVSPGLGFAKREYLRGLIKDAFRGVNPGRTEWALKDLDFYLSAQSRDPGTNRFRDVTIHLPAQSRTIDEKGREGKELGEGNTILAETADFTFPGERMRIDLTRPHFANSSEMAKIGVFAIEIDLDRLLQTKPRDRTKWKYQTSRDLRGMLARGDVPEKDVRDAAYEVHRRDTTTATFFMFILLGIPTGLLLRRGTQLGALAAAVGYALTYYLLSMRLGKTMAGWGLVPPAAAAWATTVLGSVVGLGLCWKAFRR